MDVPDNILYFTDLFSGTLEGEASGENAAKISIPGALMSGWSVYQIYKYIYIYMCVCVREPKSDKGYAELHIIDA